MQYWFYLSFGCLVLSGCITDPDTGEAAILGVVPVEDAIATAEVVAEEAKGQGGLLGIAGTVVASAIALWRRKKELAEKSNAEKAKIVAGSVIDGVDLILQKVEQTKESGGDWTPTKEELLKLLKSAQDKAGTRSDVNKILSEKAKE